MSRYRVGIDIGGTFTDHVLYEDETGRASSVKVRSTPSDLSRCFLEGLRLLGDGRGDGLRGLEFMAHGTTVNTNALLERTGARTGLLTTRGFRDVLEIGRQIRPGYYDFFAHRPAPLVRRMLRLEAEERVASDGSVLVPLDEGDVLNAAAFFWEEGVEAVAVCFMNSYVNPEHEERAREILARELPGVYVAASVDVCREFREFERASTVVADAYVGPVFRRYLERLRAELAGLLGWQPRFFIMHSAGGLMTAEAAYERPHTTIESGPAAGVVAAAELGRGLGILDVISFDMGGTTAKASLVKDGQPRKLGMFEIGGEQHGGFGIRISGLPIKTPIVDLVECSAGGGSIAWVDGGGLLKVGPRSAGAEPGPVCYGAGGTEPTVTDAHVVLERLAPEQFLGGQMRLDEGLARRALEERVARPLGITVHEAAQGVLDVVNANMVRILRVVSVMRGYDPREFALVAFGGAGPLHAAELAAELGIKRVIIPPEPGLFSAQGMLTADIQASLRRTIAVRAEGGDLAAVAEAFGELEREGWAALEREGVPPEGRSLVMAMDMRYVGQNFELEVQVEGTPRTEADLEAALRRFHEIHDRMYGHADAGEPVEIVTVKVLAVGAVSKPTAREVPVGDGDATQADGGSRRVFLKGAGMTDCRIYDRLGLRANDAVEGPAIIEQYDSTTLALPGQRAEVDRHGNLHILPVV